MPPSSDSISSTSLPFGIDNHIHASLRRSRSLPHSVHHEYQSDVHKHGPQTYPACIANAHASNPQIPPSSIHNIPKSHKIVLRQHHILFWALIGVFIISIIALTAAIVLGAVKSHQQGSNGAKCAAIIVALFGFSGMVGSAAVIWLILTGRRARARLEKRWADEERVKVERGMRERLRESKIRESIKDREQSLSRSRSRGRDRIMRPAVGKKPSFRAMTPAPKPSSQKSDCSSRSSSERRDSLWPRPLNVSKDVLDGFNHAVDEKNKGTNHEHHGNHGHDKGEDVKHDAHDGEYEAPIIQKSRDSASTQFQDLDPSIREDDNQGPETPSRPITAILNEDDNASKVFLPVDQSKSLPSLPGPSAHASTSPLETSPTYINSSHTDPYTVFPSKTPHIDDPSNHSPTAIALPPSSSPSESPPPHIPRLQHGGLGSVQSDECFRAMLDHHHDDDDGGGGLCSGDDDEDRERQRRRREEIEARVEAWASTTRLDARGRKERGKKVREAVESGLLRVAARRKGMEGGM